MISMFIFTLITVLMSDEAGVVLHVVKLIQEENIGSC